MLGGTVIMACRSEDDAMKAMRQMDKEYKEEIEKGTKGLTDCDELSLIYMKLDLSSFQSTKDFVQEYKDSGRSIDGIVCNAGISKAKPVETGDGFESMLQVNYLSHFLMIGLFLPMLKKSVNECRIVFVSSDAYRFARYDLSTMNYLGPLEGFGFLDYYGRSKLYQIMQMYCLGRRLRDTNVTVTCVHPGMVETDIGAEFKDVKVYQAMLTVGRLIGLMRTPLVGATTVINCAVNPQLKGVTGFYYKDCTPTSVSSLCKDEMKQEQLWIKTMALLQEHFTQEEICCLEGADPESAEQKLGYES
ncbi:hypothetical protein ACF0H5_007238 [Mactra antiquata]